MANSDSPSFVLATTRIRPAVCPSRTKLLCPSSTQPPSRSLAASPIASGSQEPSSSVKASVATVSPLAMPGSRSSLAASSEEARSAVAASTALAR